MCARTKNDPSRFLLYEIYTDKAAFETHRSLPHTTQFLAEAGSMVVERVIRGFNRRGERVTTAERKIGVVTDYLNRIGVAVIQLTDGELHVGDQVRIAGRTTELTQTVESLEIEHQPVQQAMRGSEVAMKVQDPVRRDDQIFRVRDG